MKIGKKPSRHLTYCLNVHPGETWDENFDAIRTVTLEIRNGVAPKSPFGLGLRLGHTAADQLLNPNALHQFKTFLETNGLYVFTINGFPYGEFHKAPVKKRVYSPDWRDPKRLNYTIMLAEILSSLLPEGLSGSISTVPGSYKKWIHELSDRTEMIRNLMRCVAHLAHIRNKTGKEIHLGLEPEPDCFIETTDETLDFFTRELRGEGKAYLAQLTGTSEQEADEMIVRHLGVCFDTCHMSLQFEDLGESISRLAAHNIRLSKIQISAALKIPFLKNSLKKLEDFCDPVYLHQVKARMANGEIRSYEDLPFAMSHGDVLNRSIDEWRIHFHVPLYFSGDHELGSTGNDLNKGFFQSAFKSGCTHFEIETYTFNVLPEHFKQKNLGESISRGICVGFEQAFHMRSRKLIYTLIVLGCMGTALFSEWVTTPPPTTRRVHVEAFRYGTEPAVIRANRGDDLIMTFSTRDTGHSFFLQDYGIDAKITPASETVEVRDPLAPEKPPSYASEVYLKAGLGGFWGSLVSTSRFRCHVYCGPMHGFEQGDLIVRPNWLLSGSLGLLLSIVLIGCFRVKWEEDGFQAVVLPPTDLNKRFGVLDRLLKWRPLQFTCTLPVLAGLMVIVLAGFFGTKVGGRNLAVMLTWIIWISMLALFLVPLGGRIWCMICPLPVMGEYLQRGATTEVRAGKRGRFKNRFFFGWAGPWPRALSGPWIRLGAFLTIGALSASLAAQPKWTAIMLMVMVSAAILMSLVWELRAFCRYVCPVAAFISAYSALAPLMVRKRNSEICKNCREKSCLRGNAGGWACPYGLLVPQMDRNADCGMCMECFKSCPSDNVSLAWRKGPWRETFKSYGEAWQAIALLVLAIAYSVTLHSPWPFMRNMVNMVDKASLFEFGLFFVALSAVALGVVPLIFWLMCGLGLWLSKDMPGKGKGIFNAFVGTTFKKTMPAVLPFGLALWAVFFVETIMANMTFILLSLSDPFGWGWDLFGTAGMPWIQIWPSGIPWIQSALILLGVTLGLKKGYGLWHNEIDSKNNMLKGFAPTAVIYILMAAGMLIYLTHY